FDINLTCCGANPRSDWRSAAGWCLPRSIMWRTENPQAADGDRLAPRWVPNLLALEIATARWPAKDDSGHSPAHSQHKHREPGLGGATDPRRTAQAWHARVPIGSPVN